MYKNFLFYFSLLLSISVCFTPYTFAYEETITMETLESVSGSVMSISANKKNITVRRMYGGDSIRYQDIALAIASNCVITKNSEIVETSDLEIGDHVDIRYNANAEPLATAVSIVVS